jgi:catechol 2,3-dioxygenase-like lactoylglutathione lyase family enzyme
MRLRERLPTEVRMGSTDAATEQTAYGPPKPGEMKLEVVGIPVSDVDRAKEFYASLGWREDADIDVSEDFRVVQFTPPGSGCSIGFGKGLSKAEPGSGEHLELAVYDIDAAREDLISRGVDVSEVFHINPEAPGFDPAGSNGAGPLPGPDPERGSYQSYAAFSDPDGNGWLLQEIRERLPGRA